jgi:hypothetical protein
MKKIGWMLLIVIAPEVGVAMAMGQYLDAKEGLRYLKVKEDNLKEVELKEDGVMRHDITMTHAFFANMGGFTAKICVLSRPEQDRTSSENFLQDEISQDKTPLSVVEKKSPRIKEFIFKVTDCYGLSQYTLNF